MGTLFSQEHFGWLASNLIVCAGPGWSVGRVLTGADRLHHATGSSEAAGLAERGVDGCGLAGGRAPRIAQFARHLQPSQPDF